MWMVFDSQSSDIAWRLLTYPQKDTEAAAVLAELCKTMNFTRIGLFYQSDVWGSSWSADFATAALDEGIRIEANMRFEPGSASSIQEALKRLADERLQVIIAITYDLEVCGRNIFHIYICIHTHTHTSHHQCHTQTHRPHVAD
jgi:hypothetical protein